MPPSAPNPAARWLKTFILTFLFLYFLPFALVRIPSFERWGGSPFGPALDYPYTLQHADADILLFGDSSAAVGLDPQRISSELGLKTINLPNTGASLQVLGQAGLDRYLAANKPPRLIVFYFAAWNLDYAHAPLGDHIFEGEEILLRRGTLRQIVAFFRHQPVELLNFPRYFYLADPENAAKMFLRHRHPAAELARTQGYFDPLANRPPLREPCTFPPELLRGVPQTTSLGLIKQYRTAHTRVAFVIAPMPACTNAGLMTFRTYPALDAAPIRLLPVAAFKQDFAYVHLRPSSVPANSTHLADLIRTQLAQP